jgi:hypothetical protein
MTVHDFRHSLALAEKHTDSPWWMETYRAAFPTLQAAVSVREDGWAQRGGVDRVLTLSCGRVVTVDEKVRDKDYGDILLEFWSNKERRVKGWVAKPLACDFIAYAVVPTATCYFLPTLPLQAAWESNKVLWFYKTKEPKSGFRLVDAKNTNYTTQSLAVPIDELLNAIRDSLVVRWAA